MKNGSGQAGVGINVINPIQELSRNHGTVKDITNDYYFHG